MNATTKGYDQLPLGFDLTPANLLNMASWPQAAASLVHAAINSGLPASIVDPNATVVGNAISFGPAETERLQVELRTALQQAQLDRRRYAEAPTPSVVLSPIATSRLRSTGKAPSASAAPNLASSVEGTPKPKTGDAPTTLQDATARGLIQELDEESGGSRQKIGPSRAKAVNEQAALNARVRDADQLRAIQLSQLSELSQSIRVEGEQAPLTDLDPLVLDCIIQSMKDQRRLVELIRCTVASLAHEGAPWAKTLNINLSNENFGAYAASMVRRQSVTVELTPLEQVFAIIPVGQLALMLLRAVFSPVHNGAERRLYERLEAVQWGVGNVLDPQVASDEYSALFAAADSKTSGFSYDVTHVTRIIIQSVLEAGGRRELPDNSGELKGAWKLLRDHTLALGEGHPSYLPYTKGELQGLLDAIASAADSMTATRTRASRVAGGTSVGYGSASVNAVRGTGADRQWGGTFGRGGGDTWTNTGFVPTEHWGHHSRDLIEFQGPYRGGPGDHRYGYNDFSWPNFMYASPQPYYPPACMLPTFESERTQASVYAVGSTGSEPCYTAGCTGWVGRKSILCNVCNLWRPGVWKCKECNLLSPAGEEYCVFGTAGCSGRRDPSDPAVDVGPRSEASHMAVIASERRRAKAEQRRSDTGGRGRSFGGKGVGWADRS